MFNEIALTNFKAFPYFEMNLNENRSARKAKALILVYGCNGIGKTSIANAFAFLAKSLNTIIETNEITRLGTKDLGKMGAADLKEFLISNIEDNSLAHRLPSAKRLGSAEPMKMVFKSSIGNDSFIYESEYDNTSIISETLKINGSIAFKASRKGSTLQLSTFHFKSESYRSKLNELFNMYFGSHTFLSCIAFLDYETDVNFAKESKSESLQNYLDELGKITIVSNHRTITYFKPKQRTKSFLNLNLVEGSYTPKIQNALEQSTRMLSMFYSSLYDNIESVKYHIETSEDGSQQYKLFFVEKAADGVLEIPFGLESNGTKNLISIYGAFWNAKTTNRIIVIDEIESGINDLILRQVFKSIGNRFCGQIIVTTHSTLLLSNLNNNSLSKKNVYILNRDEKSVITTYSLERFGRKIQKGTDTVGRFLQGKYGGIGKLIDFSFDEIVAAGQQKE